MPPPQKNVHPPYKIEKGQGNMGSVFSGWRSATGHAKQHCLIRCNISSFFGSSKKMHYYGSKWIADGNKKIIRIGKLRIKMFYFLVCYIICISSCTGARQTTPVCRLRLSTALYGKLHAFSVKTIRADDCWWAQVSNAAGFRKACQHRSKERLHRGEFLSNGHTDKIHQNRTPLESVLSSSSTS